MNIKYSFKILVSCAVTKGDVTDTFSQRFTLSRKM